MSDPAGMPAAHLPLQPGDHVRLDGRDAVVIDPAASFGPGDPLAFVLLVVVQVAVDPGDLVWVGRQR